MWSGESIEVYGRDILEEVSLEEEPAALREARVCTMFSILYKNHYALLIDIRATDYMSANLVNLGQVVNLIDSVIFIRAVNPWRRGVGTIRTLIQRRHSVWRG
jgi:hypothetical protein